MSATPEVKRPKRRRSHSKRKGEGRAQTTLQPLKALSQAASPLGDKGADDPLSKAEASRMKEHFRFLKVHKKLLKLRLNATEDLLLNGVREPTHRGVCQHLLQKVEKDRVLAVSERLPAEEAAKLLAGVLAFAPEVPYVLRYLECVSDASSRPEAARALAHALRRIQFDEASSAQMRQILTLIVKVFPRTELSVLLFNWLYNPEFRKAFDRTSDALPDELAQLFMPLRALHQALSQAHVAPSDKSATIDREQLSLGVDLLLSTPLQSLLDLPEGVLRRLLERATLESSLSADARGGLLAVFRQLSFKNHREASETGLRLARALLAMGDGERCKQLLSGPFEGPTSETAKRWRDALEAPRIGRVAIEARVVRGRRRGKPRSEPNSDELAPPDRWLSGFHLPTQTAVRMRYGAPEQSLQFCEQVAIWRGVLVPGVLRPLDADLEADSPWVAVRRVGRSLFRSQQDLQEGGDWDQIGLELIGVLNALALSGVRLPDADAGRFSVDAGGRLWLVDLWGASAEPVASAMTAHQAFASTLVSHIFQRSAGDPIPESLLELARCFEPAVS